MKSHISYYVTDQSTVATYGTATTHVAGQIVMYMTTMSTVYDTLSSLHSSRKS